MKFIRLVYIFVSFTNALISPNTFSSYNHKSVRFSTSLDGLGFPTMEEQDEEQFLSNTARNVRRKIQEKAKLIQSFIRRPELEFLSVDSIQKYKHVVVDESDKIVVVRFWASWCKSCKASEPHFMKLVSKYQNLDNAMKVKFVDVPLTQETALLQNALNVPSVPFIHIYYPGAGLVEELKLSKPHIQKFDTILNSYIIGYCDLPDVDEGHGIGAFQ